METLSPARQQALRAQAHSLHPVVMIGEAGLTESVLKEIDRSLHAHELIKIRIFSDDRDERLALLEAICTRLDAAPVQHIGKILVIYRKRPEKTQSPAAKSARGGTPRSRASAKAAPARPPSALPTATTRRSSGAGIASGAGRKTPNVGRRRKV